MSFTNDWIAYTLCNTYGFNPPRATYPARNRTTNPGKYEPDAPSFGNRTFLFAHWFDNTNVLIKFNPFELEPPV
jgi:hypothetical protein